MPRGTKAVAGSDSKDIRAEELTLAIAANFSRYDGLVRDEMPVYLKSQFDGQTKKGREVRSFKIDTL